MKYAILMEDTCGNPVCEFEHGLSVYMETDSHKILVDTGASSLTLKNAKRLGVKLEDVDVVILSHGHYDHSGGLLAFAELNPMAEIYMQRSALESYYHGERYIGIDPQIQNLPKVNLLDGDYEIDSELVLFSNISGRRCWPQGNRALSVKCDGELKQDSFAHEQCLVIRGEKNVLISGCAHNGILNILDQYHALYGGWPDVVISGFHMMKKTPYTQEEEQTICAIAEELKSLPTTFYSGHCTGEKAMEMMKEIMGEQLQWIRCGDAGDF